MKISEPAQPSGTGARGNGARALLQAGMLVALLAIAAANWSTVAPMLRASMARGLPDFSIFHTGAKIVINGLSHHLYDLSVQAQFQTAAYRAQPLPFNHPAYELLLFLPMAKLSFAQAFWLWMGINCVVLLLAARLLAPYLSNFPRPATAWVFAAAMASFPVIWALCQGQDSILLLLIFVLSYRKLKSNQEMAAGALLALGLFKFTIVLPFAAAFLLRRRWRFLGGFAAGAAVVAAVCLAITGIGGARQYLALLSFLAAHPAAGYINMVLMPNTRGFLLTALAGSGVNRETFEISAVVVEAALLAIPALLYGAQASAEAFELWFGLNVTVALLASPHLYWHDLTVLLLPIFLAGNALLRKPAAAAAIPAAIACLLAYSAAWPVWLAPLGIFPSYFFVPLCGLAIWLAAGVVAAGVSPVAAKAAEAA